MIKKQIEKPLVMICAECEQEISGEDVRGCLKHPYCKGCFKRVWNDNDDTYLDWLEREHI